VCLKVSRKAAAELAAQLADVNVQPHGRTDGLPTVSGGQRRCVGWGGTPEAVNRFGKALPIVFWQSGGCAVARCETAPNAAPGCSGCRSVGARRGGFGWNGMAGVGCQETKCERQQTGFGDGGMERQFLNFAVRAVFGIESHGSAQDFVVLDSLQMDSRQFIVFFATP
jgi:hypothetical protein